jgi:type IV pilus assembly protein PilC
MAKGDEAGPPDFDESKTSSVSRKRLDVSRRSRQLGIRQLMVWTIYFAFLALVIRELMEERDSFQRLILWISIGLGISAIGLMGALRWKRFSALGWIIFVIGFGGVTILTTGPLALPALPILIGTIIYLSHRRRTNNQDALLGIIALTASREIPLVPGILAFSSQFTGLFRFWTESLAQLLTEGMSLAEAAERMPRLIPGPSALLIRMGSESGNLAAGLREAVNARSNRLPESRKIESQLIYLIWVSLMWFVLVGFLTYFMVPRLERIFRDFGIDLPEPTIFLIEAMHLLVDNFWVPVSISICLAGYFGYCYFVGEGMGLPLLDRIFARHHSLLILRGLALAFDERLPIASSISWLAHWYPTRWVRKRLMMVELDINQGHDWIESIRSTGLLTASDAGVLASAQRAGNLPWAIRELIATGERRKQIQVAGLMQFTFIVSILALGVLVGLVCVAYFLPLTTLIARLS